VYNWSNELIIGVRFGPAILELDLRKQTTPSANSTFGYRKTHFQTGFIRLNLILIRNCNGYAYPNTEITISKPFAPYIFMGIGAENINKEKARTFYISPFTLQNNAVLDQDWLIRVLFGVVKATYDLDSS
jgi:hypothetical protein